MPLACDCFPGCWGSHSATWPAITANARDLDVLFQRCHRVLPYGSYVRADPELRVETAAQLALLLITR